MGLPDSSCICHSRERQIYRKHPCSHVCIARLARSQRCSNYLHGCWGQFFSAGNSSCNATPAVRVQLSEQSGEQSGSSAENSPASPTAGVTEPPSPVVLDTIHVSSSFSSRLAENLVAELVVFLAAPLAAPLRPRASLAAFSLSSLNRGRVGKRDGHAWGHRFLHERGGGYKRSARV